MEGCVYNVEFDKVYNPGPFDRNPCGICGWFRDGYFSPYKFKGLCGRISDKKRNGTVLYCMRPRSKGHYSKRGMCRYHVAKYRKEHPWD
jgi:hypothetical protein